MINNKQKFEKLLTVKNIYDRLYIKSIVYFFGGVMRFIHIADMHFDAPFNSLDSKKGLGEVRRLEQRAVFRKVIEYIKQNNIKFLFISGDLYDQKYVKQATIEYINNCFKEIQSTKILISPGNHDPIIKNSYYKQFKWEENVYIFNSTINKYEFGDINVYGFGFDNYYIKESRVENIVLEDKDKINILIVHGTLDGGIENQYNSIQLNKLLTVGFDYTALGHIHKLDISNKQAIYPGSTVSLGLDEPEEHGMIEGELQKNNLNIQFIKLDNRIFLDKTVDITDMNSELELIEYINSIPATDKETVYMYKIILTGKRSFEINTFKILKLITNQSILKIKDNTKTGYDLEKISKENSLKGFFIREMQQALTENPDKIEEIEQAIEIGLNSFN